MPTIDEVLAGIKKLHLEKGDVLVLNERAARFFAMLSDAAREDWIRQVGFETPVIIGDASKLSRSDLVRLLENQTETVQ